MRVPQAASRAPVVASNARNRSGRSFAQTGRWPRPKRKRVVLGHRRQELLAVAAAQIEHGAHVERRHGVELGRDRAGHRLQSRPRCPPPGSP